MISSLLMTRLLPALCVCVLVSIFVAGRMISNSRFSTSLKSKSTTDESNQPKFSPLESYGNRSVDEYHNLGSTVNYMKLPDKYFCEGVDLIVMVKSSRYHSHQRDVIRSTWASIHNVSDKTIRVVFLLGMNNPEHQSSTLSSELFSRRDLLIGYFTDTYENLTIKSKMGLSWIAESCRSPSYVILGDDDTVMSLSEIAGTYLENPVRTDVLHCGDKVIRNARVKRKGRWKVPFHLFPDFKFPPYCNGPCFIMSRDVVLAIHHELLTSPVDITVDDALLTGIVRDKIGLGLGNLPRGYCKHLTNSPEISNKILAAWKEAVS